MMKKTYIRPTATAYVLRTESLLEVLSGDPRDDVNAGVRRGVYEPAAARHYDAWSTWDDESED
jgi:hypothetical protein